MPLYIRTIGFAFPPPRRVASDVTLQSPDSLASLTEATDLPRRENENDVQNHAEQSCLQQDKAVDWSSINARITQKSKGGQSGKDLIIGRSY